MSNSDFVYRGPVRIYYANPVLGGDNALLLDDASVYQTAIPNLAHVHDHGSGQFHIVNIDHVGQLTLEDWEDGQGF